MNAVCDLIYIDYLKTQSRMGAKTLTMNTSRTVQTMPRRNSMVDGWSLKPLRLQLHPFLQVLLGSSSPPVRFGPPRDSSGYDRMGSAVLVYMGPWHPLYWGP